PDVIGAGARAGAHVGGDPGLRGLRGAHAAAVAPHGVRAAAARVTARGSVTSRSAVDAPRGEAPRAPGRADHPAGPADHPAGPRVDPAGAPRVELRAVARALVGAAPDDEPRDPQTRDQPREQSRERPSPP